MTITSCTAERDLGKPVLTMLNFTDPNHPSGAIGTGGGT